MKTITVTQEHIDRGERGRCFTCPIAHALMDAGFPDVQVMEYQVRVGYRNLMLPDAAEEFAMDFDLFGAGAVKPFSFELPL